MEPSSDKQILAGQNSGSDASVHTVRNVYKQQETEAVIFADAANAFNNFNRKVLFHNINILSSFVLTYILNCYSIPGCLFIEEENELLSQEEKTQGDLLAMEMQSIPATLLLNLLIHLLQRKFTNDVTSDGKIKDFRK